VLVGTPLASAGVSGAVATTLLAGGLGIAFVGIATVPILLVPRA
jgi:hypothetical protein